MKRVDVVSEVVSEAAIAILALMNIAGIGRKNALKLIREARKDADGAKLRDRVEEQAERSKIEWSDLQNAWQKAEDDIDKSLAADIKVISIYDLEYPYSLREISDPPAVLFAKGNVSSLNVCSRVAIIGTREPTSYGEQVAAKSAQSAVEKGFAIVSGLAYGCDTRAHEGCLDANGVGIAVMAHGLDRVYPAKNRMLAERLLDAHGCLVSEYVIGTAPFRTHFAERDRIQSGLSDAVLVIETDERGGTMHTVKFAREQKKRIACIAHPQKWLQDDKTRGNQKLIKDRWAVAIRDKDDLIGFLRDILSHHAEAEPEPGAEPEKRTEPSQHAWTF